MPAPTSLSQYESWLSQQTTPWTRSAGGAAYCLAQRLNQGEPWSAGLRDAIGTAYARPLKLAGETQNFASLTGP